VEYKTERGNSAIPKSVWLSHSAFPSSPEDKGACARSSPHTPLSTSPSIQQTTTHTSKQTHHKCKSVVLLSCHIPSRPKSRTSDFLHQFVTFPTNPHRIIPQLRTKGLFYHQNRFKRLHIDLTKQPLEPPPHPLPCRAKGFVNLLTICPLKNHITWPIRLQFYPQILRLHQLLQILQECLVFLG